MPVLVLEYKICFPGFSSGTFFMFNLCEILPGTACYQESGWTPRERDIGRWQEREGQGNAGPRVCTWVVPFGVCSAVSDVGVLSCLHTSVAPVGRRRGSPLWAQRGPGFLSTLCDLGGDGIGTAPLTGGAGFLDSGAI